MGVEKMQERLHVLTLPRFYVVTTNVHYQQTEVESHAEHFAEDMQGSNQYR